MIEEVGVKEKSKDVINENDEEVLGESSTLPLDTNSSNSSLSSPSSPISTIELPLTNKQYVPLLSETPPPSSTSPLESLAANPAYILTKITNNKNNNNNNNDKSLPSPNSLSDTEDLPSLPLPTPSRAFKRREIKALPKGILKPPPPVNLSRFSFRRDILQPFNSRLAYSAYGSSNTTTPSTISSTSGSTVSAVLGNSIDNQGPSSTQPSVAVAGGFWGSAMKKLSVVTTAALGEGLNPVVPDKSSPRSASSPIPLPSTILPHLPSNHTSTTAPHMPSPGLPTAGSPSTTPYATIHAPSTSTSTLTSSAGGTIPLQPIVPVLSVTELKKVRFRMASLKVVYPINGPNGPLAPWQEGKTKKRINEEYRASQVKSQEGGESKGWTGEALGRLYAECCRTREEPGIERVRRAFRENPNTPPKVFDLSNELLSVGAIEAFSDVLSVDFGVKKVVLESCGLDDESLKPLLHALLVSQSIPTLSLANNKRIKAKGWKLIAIFVRKARFLRYLDVSENTIDKRAAEYLVQAITPSSSHSTAILSPASQSLLELPTESIVTQSSNLSPTFTSPSLSNDENEVEKEVKEKIEEFSSTTKESRDEVELENPFYDGGNDDDYGPLFTVAPLLREDSTSNEVGTVLSIRFENCGLKSQALETLAYGVRSSGLKHISIRRNRISALGAVALAIMIRDYPVSSDASEQSSPFNDHNTPPLPPIPLAAPFEGGNSITARQALQAPYIKKSNTSARLINISEDGTPSASNYKNGNSGGGVESSAAIAAALAEREAWKNSEARNKLRKQIEELPRTGSLLTLDVKGNDIRNGVVYIAQVLKRNRTLKVLNLSENKIDVQGLVSIAEALKYNSTLETLDISSNPCCGGGLEGITSLRAAITINTNLKRVFLNNTDLSSEGAIALAEFLPEAKSLIHLDLTGNFDIDIAGVMALAVSVKMNHSLRCLDLNIPANDPDFARLSQEILQCCIRNTEFAQEESITRGGKSTITAPILKSVVARDLKARQDKEELRARQNAAASRTKDEIFIAAEECLEVLVECLVSDEEASKKGIIVNPSEVVRDLLVQAQLAEAQLAETIIAIRSGDQRRKAVELGDQLSAVLERAKTVYEPKVSPQSPSPASNNTNSQLRNLQTNVPSTAEIDSPSFSIVDSDDSESEDEIVKVLPESSSSMSSSTQLTHISIPDTLIEIGDSSPMSPLEHQSRNLTLEEGGIFRKGVIVDVEDEELDVSGEELRKEILETEVERAPVRPILEET